MANTESAIKHIRADRKRKLRNQLSRSRARTFVKKTNRLIKNGELDEARAMAVQAISALDKAAQKGVIHKNAAARRKSRLMKKLNQAQASADSA